MELRQKERPGGKKGRTMANHGPIRRPPLRRHFLHSVGSSLPWMASVPVFRRSLMKSVGPTFSFSVLSTSLSFLFMSMYAIWPTFVRLLFYIPSPRVAFNQRFKASTPMIKRQPYYALPENIGYRSF
ncbi:hypothetical protein MPH_09487 [Macrophomina phaseolina MS6]|uniref:Uncharacterized protein n=1 Tax=Macrophomina phaseolina (strain MS6) TaxID=1126212 RepID=K2QUR6_MACPH|nr:hypothetical protein MPH_09487 [Macrophomina phaseolina MS6]